ncbi:MAG: YceI family protein [Leptospiraceae bacterium]|nr:YceI family protein [Leptospiraceae bacterium]
MTRKSMRIALTVASVALLNLGFCSQEDPQSSPLTEDCTFSYSQPTTSVHWTAFKYTEKAAVEGSFNQFQIQGTAPAKNQLDVFKNATFSIDVNSVDSGNDGRDAKIKEHFFGNLEGSKLEGGIKSIEGDSGVMTLTMNGKSQEIPVELSVDGRKVMLKGSLDVSNFEGSEALKALNEVCKALHTGPDKVSKLWPDVNVRLETSLDADCN